MPKSLPKTYSQFKSLLSAAIQKASQFPSIFRFIPEKPLSSQKNIRLAKISIISTVSAILLGTTITQSLVLIKNRDHLKKIIAERETIEKEVNYWKKTTEKYQNYPDIYLKIASLEYRLGNTQIAKNLIEKALTINPELQQGRVLGEKISRQ